MGEKAKELLKLQFDKRLRLEFHGAIITSDTGLPYWGTTMNLDEALERYEIDARARGHSLRTIAHVKRCAGFFADFLSGVQDVSKVSGDDLRRYFSGLRDRPIHHRPESQKERKLSQTSINTYARAIKGL